MSKALTRNQWSPDQDIELRRLAGSGRTMEEAAACMGRTLLSVKARCRFMRISFGGRGGKSHQDRKAPDWPIDEEAPTVSDEQYIEDVLSGGGFPRVEKIAGRTTWIWPAPVRIAA